jgi:hypothetical protein
MVIRFLFWAAIVYLAYRVISALVFSGPPKAGQNQVKGKNRNRALDLSGMNVEDAKFEEIDEKKKNGQ